jgi:hypothetical protein
VFCDCVGFYSFSVDLATLSAAQPVWTQQRATKCLLVLESKSLFTQAAAVKITSLISFLYLHIICEVGKSNGCKYEANVKLAYLLRH